MVSKENVNLFSSDISGDAIGARISLAPKINLDAEPSSPPSTPPKSDITSKEESTVEQPSYSGKEYEADLSKLKYITKNKTMSYFGASVQDTSVTDLKKIRKKMQRYTEARKYNLCPPGYYDYITYKHREDAYRIAAGNNSNARDIDRVSARGEGDGGDPDRVFRIGDCYFIIPPEFITVSTTTSHDGIQGIRQSGSIQTKHGSSMKEIQVSLMLNGMNQINGYEVESPFSYKYYVDGLRTLISQFKFTPFVPIENTMINLIHGVSNVALRNIAVETVPGFPETLSVTISMHEFNAEPYTMSPNDWLTDCIDWDLYRYYIQRPLNGQIDYKLKKISTSELTNKFSFRILSDDALDNPQDRGVSVEPGDTNSTFIGANDLYVDLFDDKNFIEMISDKDNLTLTHLSFSMGNHMPLIQLSAHEAPTMQFLGATDTNFTFGFETTDQSVAAMFNEMNKKNQELIRTNRYKNGIGFLKVYNELVQLTGTEFMIMSNINVSSVPNLPGLFNITVQCVSYDHKQAEKEKLIPIKPFDSNSYIGTRDDLIEQTDKGFTNKMIQDATVQHRFQELNLYPDLYLPKYSQVDDAIAKITAFRQKHNLTPPIITDKYPRHKCALPGSLEEVEYSGYVDPDFYVFTANTLSDLDASDETPSSIVSLYPSSRDIRKALYESNDGSVTKDLTKAKVMNILESNVTENILDLFYRPKLKPDVAKEPDYAYGYEAEQRTRVHKGFLDELEEAGSAGKGSSGSSNTNGFVSGGGGSDPTKDPTTVKKRYGNPFVDFLCDRADSGCPYIWGADGQIVTKSLLDSWSRDLGAIHYTGENDSYKHIGKQGFDCSGFISWGLRKVGCKPSGWRVLAADFGAYGTPVSPSELKIGDVLYSGSHCAVYIGDGKTVEAMSQQHGIGYGTYNSSKFKAVRISGLDSAISKFLQNNPNFYMSSSSSSSGKSIVDVASEARHKETNMVKGRAVARDNLDGVYVPSQSAQTSNKKTGGEVILGRFNDGRATDKWDSLIIKNAKLFNFDPNFIKAIIDIESGGNPNSVSFADSRIVGLMQVHTLYHKVEGGNNFDPDMNIKAGCGVWAEYGPPWRYDLEKWICAYNAGPGYANAVYKYGTKTLPTETKNYIKKYRERYAILMKNGGKPGNTIRPVDGGMDATTGSNYGQPLEGNGDSKSEQPYVFPYSADDFKNPNAGKEHGNKVGTVNTDEFGKEFVEKIGTVSSGSGMVINAGTISKNIKLANNADKVVEYMYVDSIKYSMKGLLARAFPSYLLVFLDEQADWVDRKKLWTNYYVCRSAIDINIHEAYDSPIHTASVSVSNFHNNLTRVLRSRSVKNIMFDDTIVGNIDKWMYEQFGVIIDEKISDKMIDIKNKLHSEIKLEEGARVHIRLGYGSNPARYPTNFNGTLTQVVDGEIVRFVAQSDGMELVNNPITDKTNATNKDAGLSEEVSNMIAELFITRESDFLYGFSSGFFKIKSKHGIEHFGTHFSQQGILNHAQYDIVKNIYKGVYDGVPFCRNPFNPFDGESNFRFFATGKTVWDIAKMCEKALPDFVAYPRYFDFESRIYYGMHPWLCKYRYNLDKSTNILYEHAKAFSQIHEASSMDSIIENNIKIDTRNLATNMIGVYTLGGDLSTTPVIMSDRTIDWSRQVTRTIDTTSVQDFSWIPGIVDKLLSWTGMYDNGKNLAIKTCVSELMYSWRETYAGNILLLGQPEISVYDYLLIDDTFLYMNGPVIVREVVHSMSVSTGFTTSVVPGLIANNTLKNGGIINILRGGFKIANFVAHSKGAMLISLSTYAKVANAFKATKQAEYLAKGFGVAKNFMNTKGKTAFDMVKNGKIVTKAADFLKKADGVVGAIKGSKALSNIGKVASGAVKMVAAVTPTGWAAIASWVAVDIVTNIAFTGLIDMFKYRNTITLMPLAVRNPDGTTRYLVGNKRGAKKLVPVAQSEDESFEG